ncbi:SDR family NAD(P)-dependent oxidoreductase [Streptomyces mirabilis]|uniref:SDR family NAD(P)-dependent oxidoreductase n=1 Tax=Streptomyces mirabilis TaxID=68239 RepID=UPI003D9F533B
MPRASFLSPFRPHPVPGAGRPADSAPPKCLTLDSNAGPLPSATARGQPKGPYRTRTHSTGEWKSTAERKSEAPLSQCPRHLRAQPLRTGEGRHTWGRPVARERRGGYRRQGERPVFLPLRVAREGASVALVGRREERLTDLAAEITGAGGKALVVPADITTAQAAAEAVERTVEGLGRLDTLVNNAGLMLLGPAPSADLNDWRRMIDINLMGLMYTAHAAVPHLVKAAAEEPRQVADIVNIGSLAGRNAYAMSAVYSATKFGVGAFSEALRQELARQHVRVSVIEPGSVDTELRTHNPDVIQQHIVAALGDIERLQSRDIADTVGYIVTRPRHVAVAELLVRPTEQA